MNHAALLLAALGMLSSGQGKAPEEVWIETSEGWYPRLTKSVIEGTLAKSGDQIGARFELTDSGWLVTVTRKRQVQAKFRLSASRFAGIHLQDVRLMTNLDEKRIRLKIPYGDAKEECFANGSEVFESLTVNIPGNAPAHVHEVRFDDCKGRISEPATSEENGVLIIRE